MRGAFGAFASHPRDVERQLRQGKPGADGDPPTPRSTGPSEAEHAAAQEPEEDRERRRVVPEGACEVLGRDEEPQDGPDHQD